MNLFKFNGTIFYEYLKNCPFNEARNEKELPTAVLNLAKSISKSVLGIAHAEHVPDLTSKKDIEILSKIIESNYFKK
jgi:glucose-1-phosphate adenylyltransferase